MANPLIGENIWQEHRSIASVLSSNILLDILFMEPHEIECVIEDEDILVLRDVRCPDRALRSFAERIEAHLHDPRHDLRQSSATSPSPAISAHAFPIAEFFGNGTLWANDWLADPARPRVSLCAVGLDWPAGGEAEFCSTAAAFEALPPAEREELRAIQLVHGLWRDQMYHEAEPSHDRLFKWMAERSAAHPLVHRMPGGRECLLIADSAVQVADGSLIESEEFLGCLRGFASERRFVYRHEWRPGDLVIWNSASVMYRGLPLRDNGVWRRANPG